MTRTFIDASVLAAIVGMEDDVIEQAGRLRDAASPVTSAIGVWEAAVAVARLRALPVADAHRQLMWVLTDRGVEIVPISEPEAAGALEAFAKYGKGAHRAKLNLGDCFAYACAKTHGARLLYKGDDFALTDLA